MANIKVKLVNGKHVCEPTHTKVKAGEVVEWSGSTVDPVFLELGEPKPAGPPFTKGGLGPISTKDSHTVNSKPPLKSGDRFTFKNLEGDIIIE